MEINSDERGTIVEVRVPTRVSSMAAAYPSSSGVRFPASPVDVSAMENPVCPHTSPDMASIDDKRMIRGG
jgi:hypothetical protein